MVIADQVTVICIAFNHEQWIEETLESVRLQDYHDKKLVIVENGSTDDTADKIRNWVNKSLGQFSIQTIFNQETLPYCGLFNQVLEKIDSQYLIDLSGDDVLYQDHLSASIKKFKEDPAAGFVFSDADILDQKGEVKTFYKRDNSGKLVKEISLGKIYETLICKSLICSPTVVFNAEILRNIGGYDASLYYEDFDILIRMARNHHVLFSDHLGVLKRKHSKSMSSGQYERYSSKMLPSTVKVCAKILQMNINLEENTALGIRVLYEMKHALWSANFEAARDLAKIGEGLELKGLKIWFYRLWAKNGWDISWLYTKLT